MNNLVRKDMSLLIEELLFLVSKTQFLCESNSGLDFIFIHFKYEQH